MARRRDEEEEAETETSVDRSGLNFEARRLELAIDACLRFPKQELHKRQALFGDQGLEVPPARFFEGVDNAIDGIFDGVVRPTAALKRRVELRRQAGTLVRRH